MTTRTIELATHIMWNGFYDFIWKDRCIKVIDWEEKQNIKKKDKREARDKNLKLKKNRSSNSKGKKRIKIAKRDEASAREIKLQTTWNDTISNWIQKGVNPFWTSS